MTTNTNTRDNTLSLYNNHARDGAIVFYNNGHKYEITTDAGSQYTSVTTWCHSHFPIFNGRMIIANMMKGKNWVLGHKYWGMTAEEIQQLWRTNGQEAAIAGTKLHSKIEQFMNNNTLTPDYQHNHLYDTYTLNEDVSTEWEYFIKFVKDHPELKPYRTEWMVYHDELKMAGSIDMVYENPDGTLTIYDWKRSKDINKTNDWKKTATNSIIKNFPDSNFWHYTLQLNTYKAILEAKYGKIVTKMCLVRLHPDNTDETYELLEVPIITEQINQLFEQRLQNLNK
ncbi:MAG: PD-(D/E)XK nuclease family protein [Promethearchaeota archaeon]